MQLPPLCRLAAVVGLVAAAAAAVGSLEAGRSTAFPPGWNKQALTPPLGWRSWNAFGNKISQDLIKTQLDALVARNRTLAGHTVSLQDLGFASVGIDEGWEGCGQGINGTQHDKNGTPTINSRFPDIPGLVAYGHSKGVAMGWYQNGCACGEKKELLINYEGDIRTLHGFGFDAVKLDGCGHQRNLTLYAALMNATGKTYAIENCHWGVCTDSDDSSCPTPEWCPFNWFRSSGDISASWASMFKNLQTTVRFSSHVPPLSVPGCWAYPDMLEVGRLASYEEDRAHFGAWCIVSAPLILGLDLTDANVDKVLDIVGNDEIVKVNQQWFGHPGTLLKSWAPGAVTKLLVDAVDCNATDPSQHGWSYDAASQELRAPGGCVDARDTSHVGVAPCSGSSSQKFAYDATKQTLTNHGLCLDVDDWSGPIVWMYACNGGTNQRFAFSGASAHACGNDPSHGEKCLTQQPDSGDLLQLWGKYQGGGSMAVFVINNDAVAHSVSFQLAEVNVSAPVAAVRDLYWHKDLGTTSARAFVTDEIASHDSRFYLLTPQ